MLRFLLLDLAGGLGGAAIALALRPVIRRIVWGKERPPQ